MRPASSTIRKPYGDEVHRLKGLPVLPVRVISGGLSPSLLPSEKPRTSSRMTPSKGRRVFASFGRSEHGCLDGRPFLLSNDREMARAGSVPRRDRGGARRELLRVLDAPAEVRADIIRQFFHRKGGGEMAELLTYSRRGSGLVKRRWRRCDVSKPGRTAVPGGSA